MSNTRLKKIAYYVIIFSIFTSLLRIDYRLNTPDLLSKGDDASYYIHTKTIVYDFDLDYKNQTNNTDWKYFNKARSEYVPIHPIGSSFFATPFMFIGRVLEAILNVKDLHYFTYSLASVFYLIFSYFLILNVIKENLRLNINDKLLIFVSFFGSGLLYYSFERFSMTHVYEIFSVCLLFFLTEKINKNKNRVYLFLIGFLSIFLILVRSTNIFLFFTPYFYLIVCNKKTLIKLLIKSKVYLTGLGFGITTYFLVNIYLFGELILNPEKLYNPDGSFLDNYLDTYLLSQDIFSFLINIFKSLIIILFTFEFGVFYISPVIAFCIFLSLRLLYKKEFSTFFIVFIIFAIPFGLVFLWRATGSSFGFRYLLVLIPYSVILYFLKLRSKNLDKILFFLGIFSFLCFLFFETNQLTILSKNINSFGKIHNNSSPDYILGVLLAMFSLKSYVIIFFKSYFGILILKFFMLVSSKNTLLSLIDKFGYLDDDVIDIVNYASNISYLSYILIFLLLFILFKIKNKISK